MIQLKNDNYEINNLISYYDGRLRKKQKRTNTYIICDKRNSRKTGRNNKSKKHIGEKYVIRKSYNLYRLYESIDNEN